LGFVVLAEAGIQFCFVIPAKALSVVIPAKAGIHFDFRALSRWPTHVHVLFIRHPWRLVTFFSLPKRQ